MTHYHPITKPPVGALLILRRLRCPGRLTAPITTCDGKATQYISGEVINHVAGEDDP